MDASAQAFQDFERNGWNEVAEGYARLIGESGMTDAVAGALLDGADVRAGMSVVDVASGPGWVAAAAAGRGADAVGVDIATAMVRLAAASYPHVTFREGAAEALPLDDASVDAVVSAWGMPHFADHGAFLAEAQRVLRPGGRLALSTWCPPPQNEVFGLLLGSIAAHGHLDVGLPPGPDMFRFADGEVCAQELGAAGFTEIDVSPLEVALRVDGMDGIVTFLESAAVRSRGLFTAQSAEERAAILTAIEAQLASRADTDGAVTLQAAAVRIVARKP
ncbi:MAG: class I SAM-dependent methyltransferase [Acidimicrobiales bacterium]